MEKLEAKGKGEKERYTHLNAEFQRIARGEKKAFLRLQCKEIGENNRMGKTRDLFKKITDTKGNVVNKSNRLSFPPPGDLPNPGIEHGSPVPPALLVDSLPTEPPDKSILKLIS